MEYGTVCHLNKPDAPSRGGASRSNPVYVLGHGTRVRVADSRAEGGWVRAREHAGRTLLEPGAELPSGGGDAASGGGGGGGSHIRRLPYAVHHCDELRCHPLLLQRVHLEQPAPVRKLRGEP